MMVSATKQGRERNANDAGGNKALAIRNAFALLQDLDASAKDVQAQIEVHNKGMKVAPAQISNIRGKLKEKAAAEAKKKKTAVGGKNGIPDAEKWLPVVTGLLAMRRGPALLANLLAVAHSG